MSKKTLEELVFHDDFMFAAVMMDAENCRCFLERVLEIRIERVEISAEHGFFFNPECKSIRMDVFAKDENRTHYDIEMQLVKKDSLEKRSRYYHSQMDVEMLEKGKSYGELADTYVIFICDYDPLGDELYRYTIVNRCDENGKVISDGNHTIWLSSKGNNASDEPKELVDFLEYVENPDDSKETEEDSFLKSLKAQIAEIKKDRDWETRYMLFKEMMEDERAAGRAEGISVGIISSILTILSSKGKVDASLQEFVSNQRDEKILKQWLTMAASSDSVAEFAQKIKK